MTDRDISEGEGVEPTEENIEAMFDEYDKADRRSIPSRIHKERRREAISHVARELAGLTLTDFSFLEALRIVQSRFGKLMFRTDVEQTKHLFSLWANRVTE